MATILVICSVAAVIMVSVVCSAHAAPPQPPPSPAPAITQADVAALPDEQIRQMLNNMDKGAVRVAVRVTSATCYSSPGVPSDRNYPAIEYVCPKCGEKTLYKHSSERQEFIDEELAVCRSVIAEIKTNTPFNCTFDESALCAKCMPRAAHRTVAFVVVYPNGTTNRTTDVTPVDLMLVRDYLKYLDKKKTVTAEAGMTVSVKERIPRLRKLLGPDFDKPQQPAKPAQTITNAVPTAKLPNVKFKISNVK